MGRGSSKVTKAAGSGGATAQAAPNLDELKARYRELFDERREFVREHMNPDGTIDAADLDEFNHINEELDEATFNLHSNLTPVAAADKWKGEGITDLTRDEAEVVRRDLLSDHDTYMAIKSAEHGVAYEEGGRTYNTALDDLYLRNPDATYHTFDNTRAMLRDKYGDTMTLYRAGTSQRVGSKPTVNMTTSRSNAMQYSREYGTRVEAIQVPTSDVLAININRNGGYEEVIVLSNRRRR